MSKSLEDLLDEFEDAAYNREDYKINAKRNAVMDKIAELNVLDGLSLKVDKIYRFVVNGDLYEYPESDFYISKEAALLYLKDFQDEVAESHADFDGLPFDTIIVLQEIDLNNVDDIDYNAKQTSVCEWVLDEETTKEIGSETELYGMWEEVQDETN